MFTCMCVFVCVHMSKQFVAYHSCTSHRIRFACAYAYCPVTPKHYSHLWKNKLVKNSNLKKYIYVMHDFKSLFFIGSLLKTTFILASL